MILTQEDDGRVRKYCHVPEGMRILTYDVVVEQLVYGYQNPGGGIIYRSRSATGRMTGTLCLMGQFWPFVDEVTKAVVKEGGFDIIERDGKVEIYAA